MISTKLNIAKLQKKTSEKKILCLWSIRENLAKSPSIQIESDSSRCLVFFTDTIYLDSWTTWTGYKNIGTLLHHKEMIVNM